MLDFFTSWSEILREVCLPCEHTHTHTNTHTHKLTNCFPYITSCLTVILTCPSTFQVSPILYIPPVNATGSITIQYKYMLTYPTPCLAC